MKYLNSLLAFTNFINRFLKVERLCNIKGLKRYENDSEHSFQLAMLAWYIAETRQLKLNKELLLKYSLVHDLVEIYAGDTYFFAPDKSKKKAKEHKAAIRIKKEFSEFAELHQLIEKYETKSDKESQFIYALDKIAPIINIYLDNGRFWKKEGVELSQLVEKKKPLVAISPEIERYFNKLVGILRKEEGKLFKPDPKKIEKFVKS